jgi:hypothetical protein
MTGVPRYIVPPPQRPLGDDDTFVIGGEPLQGSEIREFWRWAFSSLSNNALQGDLMEWAVAQLLRIRLAERVAWTDYDLMDGRTKIQVKQSSYRQGWAQTACSIPRFKGFWVSPYDERTNRRLEKGYHLRVVRSRTP